MDEGTRVIERQFTKKGKDMQPDAQKAVKGEEKEHTHTDNEKTRELIWKAQVPD